MLARPSPRSMDRHRDFFRCNVEFDASFNGIILPRDLLDRRLPHADEHLHRVLLSHPRVTAIRPCDVTLAERVIRAASDMLESGRPPEQSTIARQLGLSTRSLRRTLEGEGTSFATVVDQVRSRRARQALREGHRLADVATSLGYESTSAFVRAFRRWTGETPAAWRTRGCGDEDGTEKPDVTAASRTSASPGTTAPLRSTPT